MLLNSGESLIVGEYIRSSNVPGVSFGEPGHLHVTNRRLVFDGARGIIVNIDLGKITDLRAAVGPEGPALLVFSGRLVCVLVTVNATNLVSAITSARAAALQPPPPAPGPPSETGKPLVFLHCRHCGTLSPAGVLRCASCGAAL